MRSALAWPLTLAILALGACSGGGSSPSDAGTPDAGGDVAVDAPSEGGGGDGGACSAPGTDLVAQFTLPAMGMPAILDVPFPSDVYRDPTTGNLAATYTATEKIVPSMGAALFGQFAQANAFGASAGAIFAVANDTAIDPASLPGEAQCGQPGASAFLVDLDAASAAQAMLPCVATYYDERARMVQAEPAIVVRPARGTVVASGHHVAALVTTGVKSTTGQALQPSATFAAIRDGDRAGAAKKLYGDALDKVVSFGVPKCSIAALTTWKAFDYDGEMVAARKALDATPAPTLTWDAQSLAPMGLALFAPTIPANNAGEYVATLDQYLGTPAKAPASFYGGTIDDPGNDQPAIAHDQIGALGTAVFQAPNFMVGDDAKIPTNSLKYNNFYYAGGVPAPNPAKPTSTIWVTIALPKSAPPANGYPVVIWQHGFSGERTDMYGAMNVFAKEGWATVAINLVAHGPRSYANAPAARHQDMVAHRSDYPANGKPWASYDGPDGMADADGGGADLVANFLSYITVRDQLRQSALDLSSLVRAIQAGADLGPLTKAVPGAKLDGTQIVYYGVSFGSIIGTLFNGEEPGIKHAVLDVNGAQLATELANHSPIIMSQAVYVFAALYGLTLGTFVPSDAPYLNVIQHLLDPGDPVVMASHLSVDPLTVGSMPNAKKDVLGFMVQWDEWVPNECCLVAAKAMGLSIAKPHLTIDPTLAEVDGSSGSVSGTQGMPFTVLVEQSPATHGSNVSSLHGTRTYQAGFPFYATAKTASDLFPKLATPAELTNPIYDSLTSVTSFYRTALAGGAIKVDGLTAPTAIPDGM